MNEILQQIDELQKQIDDLRPLSRESLMSLKQYYKIGLTWSSNAIEGNTLTESETKVVIEDGLTIGGKSVVEHLEAQGHAKAFDQMYELANKRRVEEKDILDLHRLFYVQIDETNAGRYRKEQVFISGSKHPLPKPTEVPELMKQLVVKIDQNRRAVEGESPLHPVVAAAKAHLDFVFIHPFIDGNGRVGRLLLNLILLQEGYNIALISPVNRAKYIASIEAAHSDESDYLQFIARSVIEAQEDYLRMLG